MFPSPVIFSFGTNSSSLSRSALWIYSRMIRKATLSYLICNTTERLRVWLPLSPTATHWMPPTLVLLLMPLWPTNRTRKSLEISTLFTLTLTTSLVLHLSLPLSLTECYFSQHNLLRSHSSSPRRLRLRICMSKASFKKIAHSLDTRQADSKCSQTLGWCQMCQRYVVGLGYVLDLKFSGLSGVMTQCLRLEKFLAANNQYWNTNVVTKGR